MIEVEEVHRRSNQNRSMINKDTQCGCYYCLHTFAGDLITEWVDGGQTAICPVCHIDAVLPNVTDGKVLKKLCNFWFYSRE